VGGADRDPEADGYQIELTAQSNCADVVFIVNGAETTADVVNGTATAEITLSEGENTLQARAQNPGGLGALSPESMLVASTSVPTVALDLDEMGDNVLGRSRGQAAEDGAYTWNLTGTSTGLAEMDTVQITFDPPLGAPPEPMAAGADGTFSFPATASWYRGTAQVSGTDACGAVAQSVAYDVVLDAIVPTLTLALRDGEDDVINTEDDADAQADGVQYDFAVQVEDSRPGDVDYAITVQCTNDRPNFQDRFASGQVLRSELADGAGMIQAVFNLADDGPHFCRAFAQAGPNAVDPADLEIQLNFVAPTFTITDPRQPPGGIECLSDVVVVGGNGAALEGAVLTALVTDGDAEVEAPLSAEGEGQFAVRFGEEGGPDALADGRYTVTVSGEAPGGVDVEVEPAEGVEFIVDTVEPVLALTEPAVDAPLGLGDDANMNLADCVQTRLVFQLTDATASRLCYSLGGGVERCGQVDAEGFFVVPEVTLLDGDNVLAFNSTDCAGNETRQEINIQTADCAPRIEIVDPPDGAALALASDTDPVAAGLQTTVTVASALPEGTPIEIVVDGAQIYGPVAVGPNGGAVVPVTIDLPAEPDGPHAFTLQARSVAQNAVGPVTNLTILFEVPVLDIDDLGVPCVNAEHPDASVDDGFQLALTASSERLQEGTAVTLMADCGSGPLQAGGVVAADGSVEFAPLTVPMDATCALVATAIDGAGQEARGEREVVVDRVAPTFRMLFPEDGAVVGNLEDVDDRDIPEAQGIQAEIRVRYCGAGGQEVEFSSAPPLPYPDVGALDDQRECADVSYGEHTLPLGAIRFDARFSDACGNATEAVSNATVDTDPSITVTTPDDNTNLNIALDTDLEAEGCQSRLSGIVDGIPLGTPFVVCSDADTGRAQPADCAGGWDAMGAGGCQVIGENGRGLSCELSLPDGAHELTVVANNNGVLVVSPAVSVRADCGAPSVTSITIRQDADADACLNRHERINASGNGNNSAFNVDVELDGVEDGQIVQLRRNPGAVRVDSVAVEGGAVTVDVVGAAAGDYTYWIRGRDATGNPLPEPGDAGAVIVALKLDPIVPVPGLLNLVAAQCLAAADDGDGDAADLQYQVDATAGGEEGETFTARLYIDDALAEEREVDTAQFLFAAATIGEGAHTLAYTVADPCGNVGSVAGFNRIGGLQDWDDPRSLAFSVDTIAPSLALGGVQDGQVLNAGNDANNNPADGFQTDVDVTFDPVDGIEAGQELRIFTGQDGVAIAGAPLLVPEGLAAPIDARITLPPGGHTLTARASDVCGNEGTSATVEVTVNIDGCGSVQTTFAQNPATVGPADGDVQGEALLMDLAGTVDLFNPDCVGADAQMVVNGGLAGPVVGVPANGEVAFADVPLPRGENQIALRVTFPGGQTESVNQTVHVDLGTPVLAFVAPAGAEPVAVMGDTDGNAAGQQTTVTVSVTEDQVDSPRTATLELDGEQVGQPEAVPAGSPVQVSFTGVTIPAGAGTFRVCVDDEGGNQACEQVQFNADPEDPGALADLTAQIIDPRSTEVDLGFTAPGDDGAGGGPVARYEIRRADAEIADEADWDNAELIDSIDFDAQVHAAPGAAETLTVEGLELNKRHYVSVRGIDDVGRMSAVNSAEVDLRFAQFTWDFAATAASGGPNWTGGGFINPKSMVHNAGDLDDDGFDDLLFAAVHDTGAARAAVIFGAADPADAETRDLVVPAGTSALFYGTDADAAGDVNGDGAPDLAVLGFASNFLAGKIGLYFGTPGCNHPADTAACRDAIAAPSSLITVVARTSLGVNGIGNFNHLPGDVAAYDDLVIGGGGDLALVVAGRAAWPAGLDVDEANLDRANGVTAISVPEGTAARYAGTTGDTNGDTFSEIVFSAGGQINDSYRFHGGANLVETYTFNALSADTVKLASPCNAAPQGFGTGFAGGVELDGEGGPDFVIVDRDSKRVIVFNHALQSSDCFGRGERSFGSRTDLGGDLDGDGTIDLVVSHDHPDEPSTHAYLYFNDGFGQFGIGDDESPRTPDAVLDTPASKKIGIAGGVDFTNDGMPDIGVVVKGPAAADPAQVVLYYTED